MRRLTLFGKRTRCYCKCDYPTSLDPWGEAREKGAELTPSYVQRCEKCHYYPWFYPRKEKKNASS